MIAKIALKTRRAAALPLLLAATGCMAETPSSLGHIADRMDARPTVAVQRDELVIALGPEGALAPGAVQQIRVHTRPMEANTSVHARIITGDGRAGGIRAALRETGIAADRITVDRAAESDSAPPGGRARIILRRYQVLGPRCARPPRLGCSTAANLGAMVHDPRDLRHGRPLDPAPAARAQRPVVEYLSPAPSGDRQRENSGQGDIAPGFTGTESTGSAGAARGGDAR